MDHSIKDLSPLECVAFKRKKNSTDGIETNDYLNRKCVKSYGTYAIINLTHIHYLQINS